MPAPKRVKVIGDPVAWVVFGFGKDKRCTKQNKDRNPKWNEDSEFNVTEAKLPLKLTVKDKDGVLGQVVIPLSDVPGDEHSPKWVSLEPHRKNPSPFGEVCLDCWVEEEYGDNEEIPKKIASNFNLKQVMGRISHSNIMRRSTEDIAQKKKKFSIRSGGKSMKGSVSMEFLAMSDGKRRDLSEWNTQREDLYQPKMINVNNSQELQSPYRKTPSPLLSRGKSELSTVVELSAPPEIVMITPKHGPLSGGTLVQISGENLGKSADDIITLNIGACNCLPSLEYYSSNKIMCTTGPGEGLCPVVLTTKSGGSCTAKTKYHYRRSESARTEAETRKDKDSLEPSSGLQEFRRTSMVEMATEEGITLQTGDDTDYYDPERDEKKSCSSDEDPKAAFSEVERLKNQVESLEKQNKDLKTYSRSFNCISNGKVSGCIRSTPDVSFLIWIDLNIP